MAGAFDFKKEYKGLYLPETKPGVIDVPEMVFIMVRDQFYIRLKRK